MPTNFCGLEYEIVAFYFEANAAVIPNAADWVIVVVIADNLTALSQRRVSWTGPTVPWRCLHCHLPREVGHRGSCRSLLLGVPGSGA